MTTSGLDNHLNNIVANTKNLSDNVQAANTSAEDKKIKILNVLSLPFDVQKVYYYKFEWTNLIKEDISK